MSKQPANDIDQILRYRPLPNGYRAIYAAVVVLSGAGFVLAAMAPESSSVLHSGVVFAGASSLAWYDMRWAWQMERRTQLESALRVPFAERLAAHAEQCHRLMRFSIVLSIFGTVAILGCFISGATTPNLPNMLSSVFLPATATLTVFRARLALSWGPLVEQRITDLEFQRITQADAS